MQEFERKRKASGRRAEATGLTLAIVVHVCALFLFEFTGISYIYPPPQEETFVLDFEEETPEVKQVRGLEPRSEDADREKPVELVQRSASPHTVSKRNLTPETKSDSFGDVEQEIPPRKEEPEIDPRASFPGMAKKDTSLSSPHSAETASALFKAGQSSGNTLSGATEARPNAKLEGRNVARGGLKKPEYNVQESGTVVVDIWVDQYGRVRRADPGAEGTTVTNSALFAAARKAAMETVFTQSAQAPTLQQGTITYIFKLK